MFINLEDLDIQNNEPLEMQFRQEVMNRLYDIAYQKMSQYNKDLDVVDLPEFAKLEEDRLDTKINIWITELIINDNLYDTYNKIIQEN